MPVWEFYNEAGAFEFDPILPTVQLSNAQPCQLATLNFIVRPAPGQVFHERDPIRVRYAANDIDLVKIFRGDISELVQTHLLTEEQLAYRITVQDFTARLDWSVIESGNREVEESVTDRALWILEQGPDHGLTFGGIATITETVEPFDYTGMTKREALDSLRRAVNVLYYADFDGDVQLFDQDDPPSNPAPFALGYPENPPTVHKYRDFDLTTDPLSQVDEVLAYGADGVFVKRTRPGAPDQPRQRTLNLPNIVTGAALTKAADQVLALWGEQVQTGRLLTFQPGLQAGQTVSIENSEWGIDDDWLITSVSTKPLLGNEIPGAGRGLAAFTIDFAKHFACGTSIEDLLNQTTRPPPLGEDGGCTRATTLLPSSRDLSAAYGLAGVFFASADDNKIAKYRRDLTLIWQAERQVKRGIYHQPDTQTALLVDGDLAARTDSGAVRWNNRAFYTALAAQVNDGRGFWVGTEGDPGGEVGALPFRGMGAFDIDYGPVGATCGSNFNPCPAGEAQVVWVGYVTGAGTLQFAWAGLGGSGDPQIYRGSTTNTLSYLADPGFTDPDIPPGNWPGDATLVPSLFNLAGKTDAFASVAAGSAAPFTVTSGMVGSWVAVYGKAANSSSYNNGQTGFRGRLTVTGTATFAGGSTPTDAPMLQRRRMTDGSLVGSLVLDVNPRTLRRNPIGQLAYYDQGDDEIHIATRSPAPAGGMTNPVTISGFFNPAPSDWNVDDAGNIYHLAGNVLTKYGPSGTQLWQRDLFDEHGYRFSSQTATLSFGTGHALYVDDLVYVSGYLGPNRAVAPSDWTDGSEGVVLMLAKSNGDLKSLWITGGASSDACQVQGLLRDTVGGCLYLFGAANGTSWEDKTISGETGWAVVMGSIVTDSGGEGGVDGSHTHPHEHSPPDVGHPHALDDLSDVDLSTTPPTDGQALVYDEGSEAWVPGTIEGGGGGGGGAAGYAETIGDGIEDEFDIEHGLSSRDLLVNLWDRDGADPALVLSLGSVLDALTAPDNDTLHLEFTSAPDTDQYRVTILRVGAGITSDKPFSGGAEWEDDNYWYHAFTTTGSGTLVVHSPADADVLLVGGGGGGAWATENGAGGGGAGGVLYEEEVAISSNVALSVGAGGTGQDSTTASTNGADTTFGAFTAVGGGAGKAGNVAGSAGGSGGGGGGGGTGQNGAGGSGTSGQGNSGGTGRGATTGTNRAGGGGGGASAAGANSPSNGNGGGGGNGSSFAGIFGTDYGAAGVFGGGGGGSGGGGSGGGAAGSGGGGAGGDTNASGADGTATSGGGGGGGRQTGNRGGHGGSGVVLVRTPKA